MLAIAKRRAAKFFFFQDHFAQRRLQRHIHSDGCCTIHIYLIHKPSAVATHCVFRDLRQRCGKW
jgi:hypothetical protein